MKDWRIIHGAALDELEKLESESAQCCITSPPYWGLRDYDCARQIGLEPSPDQYINNLLTTFEQVRRVLHPSGTLWLNIGDTYIKSKGLARDPTNKHKKDGGKYPKTQPNRKRFPNLKHKDMAGIPWTLALKLRAAGWYLRADIIWNKPNIMPLSVTDRPTTCHEYIFLLTKSDKYYYDNEAIKEESLYYREAHWDNGRNGHFGGLSHSGQKSTTRKFPADPTKRNKRTVWTVNTKPFKDSHFAVFPEKLILPCVLAGTKPGDLVIDPFCGSGTTGVVALANYRNFIGIEINKEYVEMSTERLKPYNNQLRFE